MSVTYPHDAQFCIICKKFTCRCLEMSLEEFGEALDAAHEEYTEEELMATWSDDELEDFKAAMDEIEAAIQQEEWERNES